MVTEDVERSRGGTGWNSRVSSLEPTCGVLWVFGLHPSYSWEKWIILSHIKKGNVEGIEKLLQGAADRECLRRGYSRNTPKNYRFRLSKRQNRKKNIAQLSSVTDGSRKGDIVGTGLYTHKRIIIIIYSNLILNCHNRLNLLTKNVY